MNTPLQVIVEKKPADGAWNMAVDAVLLETALVSGQATLRWYRWAVPTLSLGHFQSAADPAIERRFALLPRVRRLSGGGAILHDREWTYSLAIGPSHPMSSRPSELYGLVHSAVIRVLREFSIPANLRGTADRTLDHHFLCFSRGDANDVVIGPHKVLGSAQRRRRGAVLQHGSLLLNASAHAPEFPGLFDLAGGIEDRDALFAALTVQTAEAVSPNWQPGELSLEQRKRATALMPQHQL